ncbi:MAG TPA: hypothetical protein DDZ35_16520 [Halomonas sp.]|nr:hypothetical protein [Halomonas sp.]
MLHSESASAQPKTPPHLFLVIINKLYIQISHAYYILWHLRLGQLPYQIQLSTGCLGRLTISALSFQHPQKNPPTAKQLTLPNDGRA